MLSGAGAIRFYSTPPPFPHSRDMPRPALLPARPPAEQGQPMRWHGMAQLSTVPASREPGHTAGFVAPKLFLPVPVAHGEAQRSPPEAGGALEKQPRSPPQGSPQLLPTKPKGKQNKPRILESIILNVNGKGKKKIRSLS